MMQTDDRRLAVVGRLTRAWTVRVPTLRGWLLVGLPLVLVLGAAGRACAPLAARALMDDQQNPRGDVIVIETGASPAIRLFQHAADLHRAGRAPRVAITRYRESDRLARAGVDVPPAFDEILRIYWRRVGLDDSVVDIIPIDVQDPVTLHLARQVVAWCRDRGYRRVVLVCPRFHSRRSALSYRRFASPSSIEIAASPAPSGLGPDNWWTTKDGIEQVAFEWLRFAYYRAVLL
jgi:hypothetical protein